MPYAMTNDGVKLYFEETGHGTPIVFVHELAGDYRSWETQLRYFGQRYRAIAYSARGYLPSDVPEDPAYYSQEIAANDIVSILDHLSIEKSHVVGLSMGGFATLHFAFRHSDRALSLTVASCGTGAEKDREAEFRKGLEQAVTELGTKGMTAFVERFAHGPTRVQFEKKDPRGFAQFKQELSEHSATGSANTLLGVLAKRPSLYDLVDEMNAIKTPTLLLAGDEDWPCLNPALLMKRNIPTAALSVLPNCGHTLNLEAPDQFNRLVGDFIAQMDCRAVAGT